jgi:hypothetical protein
MKFSTWMVAALGVDDAEIDHRVDPHRDVVARDHVLARHVEHQRAQVDAHHLLDVGDQDDQARALHAGEAAEREHHAALVLAQDHQQERHLRVGDRRQQRGAPVGRAQLDPQPLGVEHVRRAGEVDRAAVRLRQQLVGRVGDEVDHVLLGAPRARSASPPRAPRARPSRRCARAARPCRGCARPRR